MIFPACRVDRPSALALALIAMWVLAITTGIVTPHSWITTSRGVPANGDYLGLYAAGELAKGGEATAVYNVERHKAVQHALEGNPKGAFYLWPYPPTFLLAATALAVLPYYASMLTWSLATFAAFSAAIARISTSRRDMLLMLATPAPWLNLYIGQNGALTAALIGFGLMLLQTRPVVAGVAIGLLSAKPHLGLLIPVALLAGGYYRTFASAALTVIVLVIVSIAAFGIGPWLAFPGQLSHVASLVETVVKTQKIQSLFGVARGLGLSATHALWLQGALTVSLAALIGWIWSRRNISFDLKAAALAAAVTLATPYQFVYDLVILTVAQAFLLRHLSASRIPIADTCALLLANGFILSFANMPPLPLGVFGSAIVMGIILRHVWEEAATSSREAPAAEKITAGCLAPALRPGKT